MKGNDILRQALMLLNYTDHNGEIDAANNAHLNKRSLPILNQIYADLWEPRQAEAVFTPLNTLEDEPDLNAYTVYNILPYGVAMLLAQSEGDADNQTLYASLYNQRRPGAKRRPEHIRDVLPRTEW